MVLLFELTREPRYLQLLLFLVCGSGLEILQRSGWDEWVCRGGVGVCQLGSKKQVRKRRRPREEINRCVGVWVVGGGG